MSNSTVNVPTTYYRKDKDFGGLTELISRWNVSVSVLKNRRTGTLVNWGSFTPGGEIYFIQNPDRLRIRDFFHGYKAAEL